MYQGKSKWRIEKEKEERQNWFYFSILLLVMLISFIQL